jgi:hypothetical protein
MLKIGLGGSRHFEEALVRWNYFPNQKLSASELPPNITSRRFTPEVAKELCTIRGRKKLGYDFVEYRATRYNNVSRVLGLIHPLAFARIFEMFSGNYENLIKAMDDENSAIQVESHIDGRMLIMNYQDHESKVQTANDASFGKQFRVHTDIANCFASIYSHSLEWAIQGFDQAKMNLLDRVPGHWSSQMDAVLRNAKRNETQGLPVGPASSSIAVEIILAAVDRNLREKFSFTRYVDDYTALCASHAEAQEFIRVLGNELNRFGLAINLGKTAIVELPEPLQERWILDLMSSMPQERYAEGKSVGFQTRDAFHFLDSAVRLNRETPDGSVLKFAVNAISDKVQGAAAVDVFHYVLNLAWHYPVLLPSLEQINVALGDLDREDVASKFDEIIYVNALHRRSDGMSWGLYYLRQLGVSPSRKSIDAVLCSDDCISLALLSDFEELLDQVAVCSQQYVAGNDYAKDRYWLLLYQLYYKERVANPYPDEATFEVLKKHEVDFCCKVGELSRAERYCDYIANPFIDAEKLVAFSDWNG